MFEPDYRPEDETEPESTPGGLLGWLSLACGLLAIPALAEEATLVFAFPFAIAAIVLGIKGRSRSSAPVAAGIGLALGIGGVLLGGLFLWWISLWEDWTF